MPQLVDDETLENSAVVANCRMNRERELYGSNGYDVELGFDPIDKLRAAASERGRVRWLDLCCGSARALIQAANISEEAGLPIEIVGLDLVNMFLPHEQPNLTLVPSSLRKWTPDESFDLITCIHGLYYVGDKLGLLAKVPTWLKQSGQFVASLDLNNIWIDGASSPRVIAKHLRSRGLDYSTGTKRISCGAGLRVDFELDYLGADETAGPNYTGQPAVNSHYASRS